MDEYRRKFREFADVLVDCDTDPANELEQVEGKPRRLGKFLLGKKLGEGAFGTVYRARDTQLGRDVAIKVPRAGTLLTRDDAQRFLREARAAAQLRHPNIVSIYEVGHSNGTYFIACALIEGVTLRDKLSEGPALYAR